MLLLEPTARGHLSHRELHEIASADVAWEFAGEASKTASLKDMGHTNMLKDMYSRVRSRKTISASMEL